jgi:ribosome-binding factor A
LKDIVSYTIFNKMEERQSEFWLITVNRIELSVDARYADIFVSSIKNKKILCKALAKHAQDVKVDINKNLKLRVMPIIRFRYDDVLEQSVDLLKKINSLNIK